MIAFPVQFYRSVVLRRCMPRLPPEWPSLDVDAGVVDELDSVGNLTN